MADNNDIISNKSGLSGYFADQVLAMLETRVHPMLKSTLGLDMDLFQKWVYENVPTFTL